MAIRKLMVAVVLVVLSAASMVLADAPAAGKTGTFSVNFTQRSPLTAPKERASRLVEKPAPADYDLSQSEFVAVVPDSYDPTKPMGLLVLDIYKDISDPPTPVLDLLAERNLAFVCLKRYGTPWEQKCGVNVDAVYNMEQLYHIDPTRVFVFAFDQDYCGPRLVGGYPDVFTGAYLYEMDSFWKPIMYSSNSYIPAAIPIPPGKELGVARANPVCIGLAEAERIDPTVKAYRGAGFRNVLGVPATRDDVHYPNFTKPWMEKVLDFLDAKRAMPRAPASRATTRAATRPVE